MGRRDCGGFFFVASLNMNIDTSTVTLASYYCVSRSFPQFIELS